MRKVLVSASIVFTAWGSASCTKAPEPIVVGSQNITGQIITGEIVAQHLEHRLGRKIQRRLGLGSEAIVYQEIQTRQISVYPAFTGPLETDILKEQPSYDASVAQDRKAEIVWARTHQELSRIAKLELLDPLGYDNPPALVVNAADAQKANASTLGQAAAGSFKWKIGVDYDFQQRLGAMPALNSYKLPMAQAVRTAATADLFPALQRGDLTMIAVNTIDGHLAASGYRDLTDDQHAFPPNQACLLVRQDILAAVPALRGYLSELTGKFTTAAVRKMSGEVDLNHRKPAEVAAEFLTQSGLQ